MEPDGGVLTHRDREKTKETSCFDSGGVHEKRRGGGRGHGIINGKKRMTPQITSRQQRALEAAKGQRKRRE